MEKATKVSKLREFLHEKSGPTLEAARDLLLSVEVGSTAHGMAVEGQDDLDVLSIYAEVPAQVTGLKTAESIVLRTQPEGVKSGPGDIDWTLHPLRKWMRLAMGGNPTILMMLWAPIVLGHGDGIAAVALRSVGKKKLVSKKAGNAFLGYMTAQKVRLQEGKSMRVNRPELIEQYGYDVKYAAHALRLGLQGRELMRHGEVAVPMQSPDLELVRDMRTGAFSKTQALELIEHYEYELLDSIEKTLLPDVADAEWVNYFLYHFYMQYWHTRSGGV